MIHITQYWEASIKMLGDNIHKRQEESAYRRARESEIKAYENAEAARQRLRKAWIDDSIHELLKREKP